MRVTTRQVHSNFNEFRKLDFAGATNNVDDLRYFRTLNELACTFCDAVHDSVVEDPTVFSTHNANGVPTFVANFTQFNQEMPFCVVNTAQIPVEAQTEEFRTDLGYQFNIFHESIDTIRFTEMLDKLESENGPAQSFKDLTFKEEVAWVLANGLSFIGLGWIGRVRLLLTAGRYLWQKWRKAKGYPYRAMAVTMDTLPLTPVAIEREKDRVTISFTLRSQVPKLVATTNTVFVMQVTLYDTETDPIFT